MPVIRLSRRLRDAPAGEPIRRTDGTAIDLSEGTVVEILDTDASGWTRIRADFGGPVEGWVSSDGVSEEDTFSLSKAVFAAQCVESGFNFGANAYYLMMTALQRTNVKSLSPGRPDGFIGPFALTAVEWDSMRNVPDTIIDFPSGHITVWAAQVDAFAASSHAMQVRISELIGQEPNVTQLFFAQVFGSKAVQSAIEAPDTSMADVISGLDAAALREEDVDIAALQNRELVPHDDATIGETVAAVDAMLQSPFSEAIDHVRPAADKFIETLNAISGGIQQPLAALDFTSPHLATSRQRTNAEKILNAFSAAGYGPIAQVAAVANAIGESNLDHSAGNTSGEDSHGLFQLNRNGGVGTGHSVADLKDADKNIAIMLNHILEPHNRNARQQFLTTKKLAEAVQVFVFQFERPADKAGETRRRTDIAKSIVI